MRKGIRRSSRLPKNLFGGQVSKGGYASAGFAEVVKMPRAEAWGASLRIGAVPEEITGEILWTSRNF
jgi:hypothetical protein